MPREAALAGVGAAGLEREAPPNWRNRCLLPLPSLELECATLRSVLEVAGAGLGSRSPHLNRASPPGSCNQGDTPATGPADRS